MTFPLSTITCVAFPLFPCHHHVFLPSQLRSCWVSCPTVFPFPNPTSHFQWSDLPDDQQLPHSPHLSLADCLSPTSSARSLVADATTSTRPLASPPWAKSSLNKLYALLAGLQPRPFSTKPLLWHLNYHIDRPEILPFYSLCWHTLKHLTDGPFNFLLVTIIPPPLSGLTPASGLMRHHPLPILF